MSHALLDDPPVTILDFDAFLAVQGDETLWELVAGQIVAMTNPTELHEQIVGNIGVPLRLWMEARDCRVYFGGMRVQRSDNAGAVDKPRPDLLVRCGQATARNYVTDPLVVVEVLSPSTMDTDRGSKLAFYKRLPTLRHIVLVYQDQIRAEHYRRTDLGWELETLTVSADQLVLDAVQFKMTLADAYIGAIPGGQTPR